MSERLVVMTQRTGGDDGAPWILDRRGRRRPGHDSRRRALAVEGGLMAHPGARAAAPATSDEGIESVLARLHEPRYLQALHEVDWHQPRLAPEWAPPGLPADSPVWAGVVAAAFEGARTAVSAAAGTLTGEPFVYALCRPPGHHAGPSWMGGYCYLNTAAAAAQTLLDGGLRPVAVLDLDFHFPTGTAALAERMGEVELCSLHASTLENLPWQTVTAGPHEHFAEFAEPPSVRSYLAALEKTLSAVSRDCRAIVLSLGYDTVAGDPHGSWSLPVGVFEQIGRLLGSSDLPICVVQEGGYALRTLADCSHAFARGLLDGSRG